MFRQTIIRHLLLNQSLTDAINQPRLHHQLAPMRIDYDIGFDASLLDGLSKIGHATQELDDTDGFGCVSAVTIDDQQRMEAITDARRHGSSAFELGDD